MMQVSVDISESGRVTLARVEVYEGTFPLWIEAGSAIRQTDDEYNPVIGENLALGRALRDLGKTLIRDARRMDKERNKNEC